MKKFLGILVIAGTLAACNNSADSAANAKDSLDSIEKLKTDKIDSAANAQKDKLDSVTDAKKDAIDSGKKAKDSVRK